MSIRRCQKAQQQRSARSAAAWRRQLLRQLLRQLPPTPAPTPAPTKKACTGIAFGDRFIQLGKWRIGDVDGNHLSVSHQGGKTAQIYRSDGTLHPGPRSDWGTWGKPVGKPKGIAFGDRFIQLGKWRIADIDGNHLSISHQGGKTAQIPRSDGTLHPGPRSDWGSWGRSIGAASGLSYGDDFIQIGKWRIGDIDGNHLSISHQGGKTAQIYRSDGTLHPGPRSDWGAWSKALVTSPTFSECLA